MGICKRLLPILFFVCPLALAEIKLADPTMVDGKPACSAGYFLIQDVCINQSAAGQYSAEEIVAAMQARKDPAFAKKYAEAMEYRRANGIQVYKTVIEDDKGSDIYKLENGGIVEVTTGYVGYVGYRKKALLFPDGGRWKLWIEGKKSYPVEILKAPTAAPVYVTGIGDVLDLLE
jgi:hypothetical protein